VTVGPFRWIGGPSPYQYEKLRLSRPAAPLSIKGEIKQAPLTLILNVNSRAREVNLNFSELFSTNQSVWSFVIDLHTDVGDYHNSDLPRTRPAHLNHSTV
jgi:hypothetical protein